MKKIELYDKLRTVPDEAKKTILGGRLKGFTDINPMWRIKKLTEEFGICGIGWKYDVVEQKLEQGANGEIAAFVKINLYIKVEGEGWSEPVIGLGGSMFVAREKSGLFTSDECFKMAMTDALSVACKSLGMAADVYYEKDRTKYNGNIIDNSQSPIVDDLKEVKESLLLITSINDLKNYWDQITHLQGNNEVKKIFNERKKQLTA